MELILFRHGIAEQFNERGDEERGLTVSGIKKIRKAAKGLRYLIKEKKKVYIYSSTLRRARQTADMLALLLKAEDLLLREEIVEGRFEEMYREWDKLHADSTIITVGHEPQLGKWLERLTGQKLELAKGSAAMVELADVNDISGTGISWYLTAEALDRINKNAD